MPSFPLATILRWLTLGILLGGRVIGDELPIKGLELKSPGIPESVTGTLRTINETLSKDVQPADNAAVTLVQLFGDRVFEQPLRADSLRMLGIERLSQSGPDFLYFEPYVLGDGTVPLEERRQMMNSLGEQFLTARERPWTREECPVYFDYLTRNQRGLDTFVAASKQPRYYAPLLSVEEPPRLMSASLVIEHRLKFLVENLCARALGHLANDDIDAARNDVLACHRWAALLATDCPFDVSAAKAHVIDAIAFQTEKLMLESGRVTGNHAKTWLREFEGMRRVPMSEWYAERGERAILHQELELLKSDEESVAGFFELADEKEREKLKEIRLADLPWDAARQRANEIQDGFVKALAIRDRAEQSRAFGELDRDFEAASEAAAANYERLGEWIKSDPKGASQWVGETMAYSLRPWYWQRRLIDDRARVRRDLTTIALALLASKQDRGEYPASLGELTPVYLKAVPVDAHTDEPFDYVRLPNGRGRLTSWGANRMNDAGSGFNDDQSLELP